MAGCSALRRVLRRQETDRRGHHQRPDHLDPAASWDNSWELFRNVYQTLLNYPNGATEPGPDAAEQCRFTDATTLAYRCAVREGLTFSNGTSSTPGAVKYSFDRIKRMNVPGGPAGLLGSLDRVEVKGDREVVFHLDKPDATFPFVLATPACRSSTGRLPGHTGAPGRQGHRFRSVHAGVLPGRQGGEALREHALQEGYAQRRNNAVTIRYFQDSSAMVQALRGRKIDVTYRGLGASDVVALQEHSSDEDIRWWRTRGSRSAIWCSTEGPWTGKAAVRKAVARSWTGPRSPTTSQGHVDPLYSMIPAGLTGHTTAFFDDFGEPSAAKARKILSRAGINRPVPLTLWYTTDRYGSETAPSSRSSSGSSEARASSGHPRVPPLEVVRGGLPEGRVPVFGRGWFPDFPDPTTT